jgi:sialic acid synthase
VRELQIGRTLINDQSDAYCIAELGSNHQGDANLAVKMVMKAAEAGVSAVKLQKKDIPTLYSRALLEKPYDNEASFGATYGAHKDALELHPVILWAIFRTAAECGVDCFATAFDEVSAEVLQQFDPPAYKIHSGGLTDAALLTYVGTLGKPVILSTGGGRLEDVRAAVERLRAVNPAVAVLQCTASYPCEVEQLDLRVIETYRQAFPDVVVGYSGHDNGIAMATAAYVLGARIVEKHFSLNRAMKGTDHAFSLEPAGMRKQVRDLQRVRLALGDGTKKYYPSEVAPISKMRRRETPEGWQITGAFDEGV